MPRAPSAYPEVPPTPATVTREQPEYLGWAGGAGEGGGGGGDVGERPGEGRGEGVGLVEAEGHTRRRSACAEKSATMARPAASKATPLGPEKRADAVKPLSAPDAPVPATLATAPEAGSRVRRRKVPPSENHSRPEEGSSAMPCGEFKTADAPLPSAQPAVPEPAMLLTAPLVRSSWRIRWLLVSEMRSALPAELSASDEGEEKEAEKPVPSLLPERNPASVATAPPVVVTERILLPPVSAT